jgi:transcriptional regulator with XRE-family HTH domain
MPKGPNHAPRTPDEIDKEVGTRIKLRRTMLRMSQDVLAAKVGVTFQQIQKYEGGTNRVSASRLYHIAVELSVPMGFFFETLPPTVARHADDPMHSNTALEVFRYVDRLGKHAAGALMEFLRHNDKA